MLESNRESIGPFHAPPCTKLVVRVQPATTVRPPPRPSFDRHVIDLKWVTVVFAYVFTWHALYVLRGEHQAFAEMREVRFFCLLFFLYPRLFFCFGPGVSAFLNL